MHDHATLGDFHETLHCKIKIIIITSFKISIATLITELGAIKYDCDFSFSYT